MDKILIYMLIKHNFIWDEVYNALKNKEIIDKSQVKKICANIKSNYVTIINDKYPYYLRTVLKPPFAVFYYGNFDLMNKKHICIESDVNNQNIKYLKFLSANDYVLCFKHSTLNDNSLDLLTKNHLPYIIYLDNMATIINDKSLTKMIDPKQSCFVSETYDCEQKMSTRFFYGSNIPIIFFGKLNLKNQDEKHYLAQKNNKIYLCSNDVCNPDDEKELKYLKIKNFKDFKIVFINKN